jgi:hypothetical protein
MTGGIIDQAGFEVAVCTWPKGLQGEFQRTSQLWLTNGLSVVVRRPLRESPSSGTCVDGCSALPGLP